MSVEDILNWLSEPPMHGMGPLLVAYEHQSDGNHRVGTAQVYRAILEQVKAEPSFKKKLALLPASHFVWSDYLADAFTNFIDLYMDRETAREEGMRLEWNPAIDPYAGLIGQCPDFSDARTSGRQKRKFDTAARHLKWQKLVAEKASQRPTDSHSNVCRLVAADLRRDGQQVDFKTIRRNTVLRR